MLQRDLQDELWFRVPRRLLAPVEEQLAAVAALGDVFRHLGMDRYAAICHDHQTREIIGLWDSDPDEANDLAADARQASGVEPPDTPELTWGDFQGPTEAGVNRTVSHHLEAAIDAGELEPGGRGWRTTQQEVTSDVLHGRVADDEGTALEAIHAERVPRWFTRGSDERQRLLRPLRLRLALPPDVPEDVEDVIGPVLHLLVEAGEDGIELTGTHRLRPPFVEAMAERFEWWAPGKRRWEEDVTEVWRTRELAEDMGLLHRRGERLLAGPAGRRLRENPVALWRSMAVHLATGDEAEPTAQRLLFAVLLDHAPDEEVEFTDVVVPLREVLAADGWRDQDTGAPITGQTTRLVLRRQLPLLTGLGITAEHSWRGEHRIWLTGAGRATALQALHTVATGPVTSLR